MGQSENYPTLALSHFHRKEEVYFYVNSFSRHIEEFKQHVMSVHAHDFNVLVYFTSGRGVHEINFRNYDIQERALFLLRPGQLHSWEFEKGTEGIVILFSDKFLTHYLTGFPFSVHPFFTFPSRNCAVLNEVFGAEIQDYCLSMLREYERNDRFVYTACSSLLALLLITLGRSQNDMSPVASRSSSLLTRFQDLLDAHVREKHEVSWYADKLALSPRHLARISRALSGSSPKELIQARLVLEARRLLVTEDSQISLIAEKLGFESAAAFSAWFRKQTGLTPGSFRSTYL